MKVTVTKSPEVESKGKYNQLNLDYESDGRQSNRKLFSFKNKDVYDVFLKAQAGDSFEVKVEKDGKFWNWVAAESLGKSEFKANGKDYQPSNKGNWETKEERDRRQILIIRQSSLSSAVDALGEGKMPTAYIEFARAFEAYVRGPDTISPPEMDDDDLTSDIV